MRVRISLMVSSYVVPVWHVKRLAKSEPDHQPTIGASIA